MSTKIDVIVPLYNATPFIPTLLENLKKQTFRDFRVIFVNDGSKDNTLEVLKSEIESFPFPYLIVSQENKGAAAARNAGIRKVTAPWFLCLDCDDYFAPEFLQYLYRSTCENEVDFSYACFMFAPAKNKDFSCSVGEYDAQLIDPALCMKDHYTNWFHHVCMLINTKFFLKCDLYYDEECKYCEDNTYITRLIGVANSIVRVNNVLYFYIVHPNSLSHSPQVHKFLSGIASFQRVDEEMKNSSSPAAKMFLEIAGARYYISTFRKAAVQMKYSDFRKVCDTVSTDMFAHQIKMQATMTKLAGYLFLFSKKMFYIVTRLMYRD